MNDFDPTSLSPEQEAINALERAMQDPDYAYYASERNPLLISQIPQEIRVSEEFHDVVRQFDWPSVIDDGAIKPVHEYENAADFVEHLRDINHDEYYLNNLNAIFRATPTETFDMSNHYGTMPALHRAYVIAPDLFSAIRTLYVSYPQIEGNRALTRVMQENQFVAEALHTGFKILGRLIKRADMDTQMKLIDPDHQHDSLPVRDAQEYLTT